MGTVHPSFSYHNICIRQKFPLHSSLSYPFPGNSGNSDYLLISLEMFPQAFLTDSPHHTECGSMPLQLLHHQGMLLQFLPPDLPTASQPENRCEVLQQPVFQALPVSESEYSDTVADSYDFCHNSLTRNYPEDRRIQQPALQILLSSMPASSAAHQSYLPRQKILLHTEHLHIHSVFPEQQTLQKQLYEN